jgi:hypothetical protein
MSVAYRVLSRDQGVEATATSIFLQIVDSVFDVDSRSQALTELSHRRGQVGAAGQCGSVGENIP